MAIGLTVTLQAFQGLRVLSNDPHSCIFSRHYCYFVCHPLSLAIISDGAVSCPPCRVLSTPHVLMGLTPFIPHQLTYIVKRSPRNKRATSARLTSHVHNVKFDLLPGGVKLSFVCQVTPACHIHNSCMPNEFESGKKLP